MAELVEYNIRSRIEAINCYKHGGNIKILLNLQRESLNEPTWLSQTIKYECCPMCSKTCVDG